MLPGKPFRFCPSHSDFWEDAPAMEYPEPTRPGLYLADGDERHWIGEDTSEAAWDAAVATTRAVVASQKLSIFSRPKVVQISAAGIVVKHTKDLSLPE